MALFNIQQYPIFQPEISSPVTHTIQSKTFSLQPFVIWNQQVSNNIKSQITIKYKLSRPDLVQALVFETAAKEISKLEVEGRVSVDILR